tara:strand:- start:1042 stop:1404 length:363 start_codon:yes stop_codon:yes gene_type:complete
MWQECRGEPEDGQRAVAHVIVNRVKDGRWGKTLATVCMWGHQFSGWNAGDANRIPSCLLADEDPLIVKFIQMLNEALTDPDPTFDATHYYATSMKTPPFWAVGQTPTAQIGRHRFFAGIK